MNPYSTKFLGLHCPQSLGNETTCLLFAKLYYTVLWLLCLLYLLTDFNTIPSCIQDGRTKVLAASATMVANIDGLWDTKGKTLTLAFFLKLSFNPYVFIDLNTIRRNS